MYSCQTSKTLQHSVDLYCGIHQHYKQTALQALAQSVGEEKQLDAQKPKKGYEVGRLLHGVIFPF